MPTDTGEGETGRQTDREKSCGLPLSSGGGESLGGHRTRGGGEGALNPSLHISSALDAAPEGFRFTYTHTRTQTHLCSYPHILCDIN
jgi:hypothetical protein